MEQTPLSMPAMADGDQPRSQPVDDTAKSETPTNFSPHPPSDPQPLSTSSKSPSHQSPLASTEFSNMGAQSAPSAKKKGTAASVKKAPKRPKNGPNKTAKKARTDQATSAEPGSEDEESDHGPYCICRGPDDHRWMICCEKCEDWFHGECINLDKDIGESLIEKFVCPNCTSGTVFTLYKKTCMLSGCRKSARLNLTEQSVFCSNEHAQTWWERMVGRLPKVRGKGTSSNQLTQEEFMALLQSDISGVDEEGRWTLAREPFSKDPPNGTAADETTPDDQLSEILSTEERELLENAKDARFHLAEETFLCRKMLDLIELAQERRRAAITDGRFGEDICGYDQRLDTVLARDAFAAFVKTPDGEAIFKKSELSDPAGEDDPVRGMCERKRCKVHSGWYKMLVLGIRYQIREMAGQAEEVSEEERLMREAARERHRRKQAEKNWVAVLDD